MRRVLRMNLETPVFFAVLLKGPFEGRLLEEMLVNDIINYHECRIKTRSQPRS